MLHDKATVALVHVAAPRAHAEQEVAPEAWKNPAAAQLIIKKLLLLFYIFYIYIILYLLIILIILVILII